MNIKTNWSIRYDLKGSYAGDYFNVEDYERIRSNIEELRVLACRLYPSFSLAAMRKLQHVDFLYARDINQLENNLMKLVEHTFPFTIEEKKTFQSNDPFLTVQDLNRLELGIQHIYTQLKGQYAGAKRLAFSCGGGTIAC